MKTSTFEHKGVGKVTHIDALRNDYTLCGLAITDSRINIEGFEWLRNWHEEKPNCKDCLEIVNFCKSVPSNFLKRKPKSF